MKSTVDIRFWSIVAPHATKRCCNHKKMNRISKRNKQSNLTFLTLEYFLLLCSLRLSDELNAERSWSGEKILDRDEKLASSGKVAFAELGSFAKLEREVWVENFLTIFSVFRDDSLEFCVVFDHRRLLCGTSNGQTWTAHNFQVRPIIDLKS